MKTNAKKYISNTSTVSKPAAAHHSDAKANAKATDDTKTKTADEAEAKTAEKADAKSETKTSIKTDAKTSNKSDSNMNGKSDPKMDAKTDPKMDSKSNGNSNGKADGASQKTLDAISLLRADHKAVSALFEDYKTASGSAAKQKIVAQICTTLSVHAQVEEEIFYPAFKAALKDQKLVPEAIVEHASLKDLIAQVEDMKPDGEMYDAKIMVMCEYVEHHVKEEQDEMFVKAKSANLDLAKLGMQMAARKEELLAERKLGSHITLRGTDGAGKAVEPSRMAI